MFKDKEGHNLSNNQVFSKIYARILNYFIDFELMLIRWVGHIPSHYIRRFFYRLAGVKIGKGSTIHMWCNFFNPAGVVIGDDTIIGDNAFLDGRARLQIGNHTAISSQVLIYNSEHNINSEKMEAVCEEVNIGDYVFIGPRAIILPGIKIENGAVVAAGAVVTHNVPTEKIVGGVPAREIGERKIQNYNYRLGRARWFQ